MVSLEQVQLLESRVAKAIEYVQKVTAQNDVLSGEKAALSSEKARLSSEMAALSEEKAGLQAKLEANQKRLDELETLVMRFKEDQSRIEDGIIAALDRLSQFEEAFENSLKEKAPPKRPAVKKEKPAEQSDTQEFFEISRAESSADDEESAVELDIF